MLPETFLQLLRTISAVEWVAVVAAMLYLLLAIREHIACWLFAALSTALYVYIFTAARLYMESALNVFYFGMAIYGWIVWNSGRAAGNEMPVTSWALRVHSAAIAAILGGSLISGFLLDRYTDAEYPYVDSLTTWAAIWATFLVARKVLENWWYWLAIDSVSIALYWSRDLQLTAGLFGIYLVMIPFGLLSWTRSWKSGAT